MKLLKRSAIIFVCMILLFGTLFIPSIAATCPNGHGTLEFGRRGPFQHPGGANTSYCYSWIEVYHYEYCSKCPYKTQEIDFSDTPILHKWILGGSKFIICTICGAERGD